MFLPVDFSVPSSPGEELPSSTLGPDSERSRSTLAKVQPEGLGRAQGGLALDLIEAH